MNSTLQTYLGFSTWLDGDHPAVAAQAAALASASAPTDELVEQTFEFVREHIEHSGDTRRDPVTCKAAGGGGVDGRSERGCGGAASARFAPVMSLRTACVRIAALFVTLAFRPPPRTLS